MAAGQGKRIPDTTRAAIIAGLLEGQSVTKIAETYKINHSTVSRLKKAIPADKLHEVALKKDLDIATQIANFLDASFEAMLNVLAVTRDNAWLSKQPASELATFNGVTADKVFRVLEAIENAQSSKDEGS